MPAVRPLGVEMNSCPDGRALLSWSVTQRIFDETGASIQDVFGLDQLNKLLMQQGTVGEPIHVLHVSKSVVRRNVDDIHF
jgi:hypothetical protein